MFTLLFVLLPALALCLMSVVFPISALLSLVRAGRLVGEGQHWSEAVAIGPLIRLSVVALLDAFAVYVHSWVLYAPSLFPEDTCFARAGIQEAPVSHDAFPLSTVCPSSQHGPTGLELVPPWVNPTITALVVASAVILAAVYAVHLRRT